MYLSVSIFLSVLLACLPAGATFALPDAGSATLIEGLTIYRDAQDRQRYYYLPEPISIAATENGRPALTLMLTRYVGTNLHGDQGEWTTRSFLTTRLQLPVVESVRLNKVRASLKARHGGNPRLRALPLYGIEAAINYTPVDSETSLSLPATGIVTVGEDSGRPAVELWSERAYSLPLGGKDAQLLASAFESGQTAISFSYAYLARFSESAKADIGIAGDSELAEGILERLDALRVDDDKRIRVAYTDAAALVIDPADFDYHVRKIDINDRLPPGYASLDVYCYDFQQESLPDQYEKRLEVEATGPTGKTVTATLAFNRASPEIYGQTLKISRAVDFAKPFRYRVISISNSGQLEELVAWTERERWTGILDISSY